MINFISGRSSGVERNLAKVEVEGSNPFARSKNPYKPSLLSVEFFITYLIIHVHCDPVVTEKNFIFKKG